MKPDRQREALDVPYSIFSKENEYPHAIRRQALERVCLPMLRIAHTTALTEFFLSHIVDIMNTIDTKLAKVTFYENLWQFENIQTLVFQEQELQAS